jgi:sulfur carrier protein ThiS
MPDVDVTITGKVRPVKRKAGPGQADELVASLGINPLEVLIKVNGEFVPDCHMVRAGDRVELIEITSRG